MKCNADELGENLWLVQGSVLLGSELEAQMNEKCNKGGHDKCCVRHVGIC